MIEIDWEFHKAQINVIYWLSDKQVEEGLSSLCSARQLYDNLGPETPECIILYDGNNTMVHKIMTQNGKPCTVEVKPPWLCNKIKKIVLVCGLIGLSTIGAYYYLTSK